MPWLKSLFFIACLTGVINSVQAGVLIGGTRVIYDGAKKEAAISVTNEDKDAPYLIQSWVDNFDTHNANKVPFMITPPLFRLDGGKESSLRILFTGNKLPQDHESIYWLNIKSIPSSQKRVVPQI